MLVSLVCSSTYNEAQYHQRDNDKRDNTVYRLSVSMTDTSSVMESARKRKRVEVDVPDSGARSFVHQSQSSSDFSVSTSSKDVLEISETNPEAKFIKVFNSSVDKV